MLIFKTFHSDILGNINFGESNSLYLRLIFLNPAGFGKAETT